MAYRGLRRLELDRSRGAIDPAEVYAWTYERLLFPAWQSLVHGRAIKDHLERLESTQWQDASALERDQVASLRALLTRARRAKYYRELFAKIGFDPRDLTSREDLQQLPLLTREIIHARYDDLLDPERGDTIRKGTSGTTGRPMRFEYSAESETWRQAMRLRGYGWAGYRHGLPVLHFWAPSPLAPHGMNAAKIRLDRALRREVYLDSTRQDGASLARAVEVVKRRRPHVLIGYSKATALFAHYINDRGLRTWAEDIPVICAAESLHAADRAAIERAFGPAFETYGSRETMLVGAECAAHAGLHLSEENLVVEIVKDGRPVPPGETGDVVITDLHNDAMPFIRYVNGDLASMATGTCRCGRGLRRLARVDGRKCDTLSDSTGAPIPGMAFIVPLARPDDLVRQFQVVQRRTGEVLLRIVPGTEWNETTFATEVEGRFREQLRGRPFRVERCEAIPPGASGKHRFVTVE